VWSPIFTVIAVALVVLLLMGYFPREANDVINWVRDNVWQK
jgi:hypothetical protein